MTCPKCAAANADASTHCSNCGAELGIPVQRSGITPGSVLLALFLFFVGLVAGVLGFFLLIALDGWVVSLGHWATGNVWAIVSVVEAVLVGSGTVVLLVRTRPPLVVTALILGATIGLVGGLVVCSSVGSSAS